MTTSRRATFALPLLVAGCGATGTVTPATIRSDVDLWADLVKAEVPVLIPAMPPDTAAQVTKYATEIEAARQTIDATLTAAPTLAVNRLVADMEALAPIAAKYLPAGSPVSIAFASALALAPVILAYYGVPQPPGATTARRAPAVDPVTARARIRAALGG